MRPFVLLLMMVCLIVPTIEAQHITHGPVWGAVTDSSGKVYLRTSEPASFTLEISEDSNFSDVLTYSGTTRGSSDTSSILELKGLKADTRYFYRIYLDNELALERSRFSTFPSVGEAGNHVITFGSCHGVNDSIQDSLYLTMADYDPDIFLQIGDWQYPDRGFSTADTQFYSTDMANVVSAYRERYSRGPFLPDVLKSLPVGYMYDDHDFTGNEAGRNSVPYKDFGGDSVTLSRIPYPSDQTRNNVIEAYQDYFPHYPLQDTDEGIYHKFRLGNAVFFMLDIRSNRSDNLDAFEKDPETGEWSFNPSEDRTILGQKQLNWLLEELTQTEAMWKFLVTPVIFNQSHQDLLSSFLNVAQIVQGDEALSSAAILADKWAGFPKDQDTILQVIEEQDISNVIALSGDAHTAAIDDGSNAGVPEILSGNLAQRNSRMVAKIDSYYVEPVWNQGGQGLDNNNFNSTFGKVEIFGNDSVRLSIHDRHDQVIARHTVEDTTAKKDDDPVMMDETEKVMGLETYPNPANERLNLEMPEKWKTTSIKLYDINGQLVRTFDPGKRILNIRNLPAGYYILFVETEKALAFQKVKLD